MSDETQASTTVQATVAPAAPAPASASADLAVPRYMVTNRGDLSVPVPIFRVNPDKTVSTDTVFVAPKGKPKLPEGFQVTADFLRQNPRISQQKIN